MDTIHPSAVVDPRADIAADVTIGPMCVVESGVVIREGCRLQNQVTIKSGTSLGPKNTICEGAVLGGYPQHLHAGENVGTLEIGSGNTIRENATIHRALKPDARTTVGDDNLIMVNAHVAHDCVVGNHTIITNNAMIAGHVAIQDRAYISGAAGVHQFCRIGQLAMVGGQAHLKKDVPPFVTVDGLATQVVGLNLIGLRRAGYSHSDIQQLKEAYRVIYRHGLPWDEMLDVLKKDFATGPAACYHEFLSDSTRGIVQERRGTARSTLRIYPQPSEEAQNRRTQVRSAS